MRQLIIVVLAVVLAGFYSFYNPAIVYAGDPIENIEQSPEAQFSLGLKYLRGEGVPQNYTEAAKWFRMAAEQGKADAQHNLGGMYAKGDGVPQDYAEAAKWWRKAAEQGDAGAQFNLGLMYAKGEGVPQDYAEAAKWWRKSAEQGDAGAQYNLGLMYEKGEGVPQDYAEAAKWWRKSAEQGDAGAQYNLGLMYEKGQGVPKNYILAYAWLNLAAAQGQLVASLASTFRDVIAGKMTPAQIAEAQKLSAQLQQEINRPSASPDSKDRSPKTSGIPDRQVKGSGSGFIITKDGYVMTCQHVIDHAESIEVAIEDHVFPAKLR